MWRQNTRLKPGLQGKYMPNVLISRTKDTQQYVSSALQFNYMRLLLSSMLFLIAGISFAQKSTANTETILLDVNARQTNISRIGMTSLTGWAAGNMAVGGIMMTQTTGQERYFHQMNLFWNVVNLGIGIPGLIGTYKSRPGDFESTVKYQKRLENIYVLNAGLDIGYMASGWALNNFGKTKDGQLSERLKGYGNSLVMQGAYLFVHDLIMYSLYRTNNRRLDLVWKHVTVHPTGLGMVMELH